MTTSDRTAFSWASPGMGDFGLLGGLTVLTGESQRGTDGLLRETQDALRDSEERYRRLEENLRQSQKLEAVGQLSGGLAHDFNNLLTVIQGHVGLLDMDGGLPEASAESLREIGRAATRAASLTQQLLAFSRKQVMQMRNLDLNDLVKDLAKMLGRVLREDIALELGFSIVPMVVNADAGMIEQAVINLVVNARDAMPSGGRLVVTVVGAEFDLEEARRPVGAQPGTFVRLSVKDSGIGIAPEVLPKIFEPFFTTKDIGKGSGLGLATAYGIVRQHGGWIDVESQPGKGTTFHLYLPRQAAAPAVDPPATEERAIAQGTETVLLVEDEVLVRRIMATFLVRNGYTVLTAENGASACMVWQQYRDQIDLLVTDLVMPKGMGGRQLAEHLISDRPDLRVIYTSGYSPELAGKDLALRQGTDFLPKPFDGRQLAAAVRTSLDRRG